MQVQSSLNPWIERQACIDLDLEKCNGKAYKTGDCCQHCVAVNHCWFVYDEERMPKSVLKESSLLKLYVSGSSLKLGQLHPKCHCKNIPIPTPNPDLIVLNFENDKFKDLYARKLSWMHSMGYNEEDLEELKNIILSKSKLNYVLGNYRSGKLDSYGVRLAVRIEIPGKDYSQGKSYKIIVGWMAYPYGTLKLNTCFGGNWK